MQFEKRKSRRSGVTRQPKGTLQILLGELRHAVLAVEDASPTGIRLRTSAQINVGSNIMVRYFDEKIDMKVNGVVVWNSVAAASPEGAGRSAHIIGIELASPSLLQVFL
jgi:hypothetical protein